jgi:hypothetical protein
VRRAQHLSQEHRAPSQSSWRAHGSHSYKPSRRWQPPRVTSRWRFLEESLVAQTSRALKSSTRISHTHNGSRDACVRKEMALRSQVCYWNGQETHLAWDEWVYIAHTPKTSRWEDSAHFVVRRQYNSRSDCHNDNGYIFKKIDHWTSWWSDRPWWWSDHPGIEAGSPIGP